MSQLPRPRAGQYEHFGAVLRKYRQTVSDRLQYCTPGLAQLDVPAAQLITSMREKGYQISPATYSAIENGDSLPREPDAFIDTVCRCLAIKVGSLEWWTLTLYASHGVLSQKLGQNAADTALPLSESDIVRIWRESNPSDT
jgi:hypothetical protein